MSDIRNELRQSYLRFGFSSKVPCSEEENKKYLEMVRNGECLPEDIVRVSYANGEMADSFSRIVEVGLSDSEKQEYIMLKQLETVKTIKGCVVFFTILTVLSLLGTFLAFCR